DLFPKSYHEFKGVHESLGKMKIKLKESVHRVKKRPYRMNLNLYIKMKEKIDKMLKSGIIEPIEESEWVIPIVININKDGRIMIYVDYRELNAAC
ncbi:hypothetical protein KI387_011266, partial [Taxus chinensis]